MREEEERKSRGEAEAARALAEAHSRGEGSSKDHMPPPAAAAARSASPRLPPLKKVKLEEREDGLDPIAPAEALTTVASTESAATVNIKRERRSVSPVLPPPPTAVAGKARATLPSPAASSSSSSSRDAFSLLMSNTNVPGAPLAGPSATSLSTQLIGPRTSTDLDPLLTPSTLLKLWSHCDAIEGRNRALKGTRKPRGVPFYKVLHGMPLSVDAFRFGAIPGCVGYFLSHAHSDHYVGLSHNWSAGPVYCTETTANLLATSLRVPRAFLHPLPLQEEVEIPHSGGIKVTLLPANHCPGSCVFLFRGPRTAYILQPAPASYGIPAPLSLPFLDMTGREKEWIYLHCGDFRASPYLLEHPRIKGKHIDIIYLDTTYLNPRYCFPAQEEVVRECGQCAYGMLASDEERARADEQRRKWESEGIVVERADSKTWRVNKREREAEEKRIQLEGERRGMRRWMGIQDTAKREEGEEDEKTTGVGRVVVKPPLGTLAKGLFRYDEEPDSDEDVKVSVDEDEEAAWMAAHQVKEEESEADVHNPSESLADLTAEQDEEEEDADDFGLGELAEEDLALDEGELADLQGPLEDEPSQLDQGDDADFGDPDDGDGVDESKADIKSFIDTRRSTATQSTLPFTFSFNGSPSSRLLVLVGTYSIGKEKVALSCALRLGTRIFCCDQRKYRIFQQLVDEPLLQSLLTKDPFKAQVHVTNLFALNFESLTGHLKALHKQAEERTAAGEKGLEPFGRIVAFRPTGWAYKPRPGESTEPSLARLLSANLTSQPYSHRTFQPTRDSTRQVQILPIPYSEHSSFLELSAFMIGLDSWGRCVPTVNVGNGKSRAKMEAWIRKWKEEGVRRRRKGKKVELSELARQMEYF